MREHSSELISLCYAYVRYPRDGATDRESVIVFADRQDEEGSAQKRYVAGFQFDDGDAIHPIEAEKLAELCDAV